ncbi:hypothetical protein [Spirosoma flavum]|uniref:Lipoprotein n=1 Tax=Spirosoma flavum TaxID=2048557 RepID=A0ABW6AJ57_9BACT
MNRFFFLSWLSFLLGCQPNQVQISNLYSQQSASQLSGSYQIQYQVVKGDTVWSTKSGSNKLGYVSMASQVIYQGDNKIKIVITPEFSPRNGNTEQTQYTYSGGTYAALTPTSMPNEYSYVDNDQELKINLKSYYLRQDGGSYGEVITFATR